MKTTHILLAAVLAATSAVQAATAEHKLPAPLPEYKTPEQLAKWRKEMTEKARAAETVAKQANSTFYTGKPYIDETGSYAFKFRQYDPELSRWTTSDPSGFPDGANNCIYGTNRNNVVDTDGLLVCPITVGSDDSSTVGYTSFSSLSTTVSATFTTVQSGQGYVANATLGYSFTSGSTLHLVPTSGSRTVGTMTGILSQTFRDTTYTHEAWHGVIYAMALSRTYGNLESWSSSYSSNVFRTSAQALSAASADMTNAFGVAGTTNSAFWSSLGTQGHGSVSTGATVNGVNCWESINPEWGGPINEQASELTVAFSKTPGNLE